TCFGNDAKVDEGHHELGVFSGVDQVAVEKNGHTDTNDSAVHRSKYGLLCLCYGRHEAHRGRNVLTFPWVCHAVFEIVSGCKRVTVPVQQHHPYARIRVALLHRFRKRGVHSHGEGVLLLGAIEGDAQYVVFEFGGDSAHDAYSMGKGGHTPSLSLS